MSEETREPRVGTEEGIEIQVADYGVARVAKLGESITEIQLHGDTTISSAIPEIEGYETRVNGEIVDGNYILQDEDVVTQVPNIKAG